MSAEARPRAGTATVTFTALEQLLGLPAGHLVADVQCDVGDRFQRVIQLVITGPMLPDVPEGERPRQANAGLEWDETTKRSRVIEFR